MSLLELKTVECSFSEGKKTLKAVDGVDLLLNAGENLGLVGESGCGKSTLSKLASGLLAPSAGQILFQGLPLPLASPKSPAVGKIQMVFQDPFSSLNPRMTVGQSVAEPLQFLAKVPNKAQIKEKVSEIFALIGLKDLESRYPHEFSGGQRQRIALARALITRPDLLICDEPVSALDVSIQAQILNLLLDLQEQFKQACLFVSHDLAVVGFMCSKIMVMHLGRIVEEGPKEQIFKNPAHPYTQLLLNASSKLEEEIDNYPQILENNLASKIDKQENNTQENKIADQSKKQSLNPEIDLYNFTACRYFTRCPKATEICQKEAPTWQNLALDWRVRCHHVNLDLINNQITSSH